ncbi:MAG: DUF4097 family beta strand repeat-containing protein [Caldilineales bacterium]
MIEVRREYSIEEVQQIKVALARGDVYASAGNGAVISLRARIHGDDEDELELALAGRQLRIGHPSNDGDFGNWGRVHPAIDVELTLPAGADLPLDVQTGKGDVRLSGVKRTQAVRTGKGDVSVAGTVGQLAIESGAGDISVAGCGGELTIHTGSGDVQVGNSQASLAVRTGRGDISIDGVVGSLDVSTGSGDVSASNWQASENGAASSGSINTGSGDVALSYGQAESLRVQTGRGDCALSHLHVARLHVKTGSGDLVASGDPGVGQWQLNTSKGDIVLKVPGNVAARIEASTRRGSIHSDLPQVKVGKPGPAGQHSGRTIIVLGDEPRAEVLAESGKGDIVVRATGPVPVAVGQSVAVAEVVTSGMSNLAPSQPVPVTRTVPSRDVTMGILESLSRGEISVDEAETLLKALA